MKMMLWKEIRENFKWALLALLALTLAEFYVLSSQKTSFQGNDESITLCSSSFLLVTAFGSAAVAAFLGVVQILPELRRDRWSALLHRPVTHDVIFFGKAFAGLLLYFFATIISFAASTCFVALPGEFPAPFVPGMMLPGLSDIVSGGVFYFAAVLLCLHHGRWFGTRGAIIAAAVMVFLTHGEGSALFVFGESLLAAFVFMLAARGAMLGSSPLGTRPWSSRTCFVLTVLGGVQFLLLVLGFCIIMIPWPWLKSPHQ